MARAGRIDNGQAGLAYYDQVGAATADDHGAGFDLIGVQRYSLQSHPRYNPALDDTIARIPLTNGLFDLTGKTALVTGASSGLGAHFAEVLAVAGACVILAARREKEWQR